MKDYLYKIIIPLSLVGIGLAIFLFYEYLFQPEVSPCYINSVINCEASTKGPLATTLGIPTALYGLLGYIIILVAAIKKWPKLVFGMSTFGLVFCLRITFIELFFIKQICPVCLACQVIMAILFILSILLLKQNKLTLTEEDSN